MNALRVAVGTRPQRRRYLALGWVLGAGAFALGATLVGPFVAEAGPLAGVAGACLFVLAAVAAYDGAGAPVTVALVALVAAGLTPFVTVGVAAAVPIGGTLAVQLAFVAAVAVVVGVALGVPGFAVGAAGRWWVDSRRRRAASRAVRESESADSTEPGGTNGEAADPRG